MHKYYLLIYFLMCSGVLFGQETGYIIVADPGQLKGEISRVSENTNTIQADFIQEKYMDILSNILTSKGTIAFKRPDKLRWEYIDPFQYLIILNEQEIIIKDEEKTNTLQLESSKVFQEINNLIISSVQGDILDSEKFDIEYFESPSDYLVKLKTRDKNMKEIIEHIEMYFKKSDIDVYRIKLIEPTGDYTNLIFENRKLNLPIDDSSFSLH